MRDSSIDLFCLVTRWRSGAEEIHTFIGTPDPADDRTIVNVNDRRDTYDRETCLTRPVTRTLVSHTFVGDWTVRPSPYGSSRERYHDTVSVFAADWYGCPGRLYATGHRRLETTSGNFSAPYNAWSTGSQDTVARELYAMHEAGVDV